MPLHKDLSGTDLHPPGAHKTQHENGGSDEMSVAGLSGTLADPQPTTIAQITDATAAGKALLDDADAAAQRTTLGLGTMATAATSDYAALAGATFTGDVNVPDEAYDATNWNGSTEVPTKNAVRDKIESLTVGGGGALVLLESHTASASSSLDFTAFISGSYDSYLIVGSGIIPATDGADLLLQVGTGGGPSYDTGGTNNYQWSNDGLTPQATDVDSTGTTGAPKLLAAMANGASTWSGNFNITAANLASSALGKNFFGTGYYTNTTGPRYVTVTIGGIYGAATAVTALRFIMSSGNIASGTIRIYGLANS